MKSVLITGAYGGMGKSAANLLAKKGFKVFALDKAVGAPENNIIPVKADVTDTESLVRAFDAVKSQTDGLYAVVHFAGVYMLDSLVEMSEERFKGVFDVNLFGAYRVNKIFLPLINRGGRIVVTTSELAATDPLPFTGIYAITKTALDGYAFSLRMELQLLGIKVSVIRAGAVDTGLLPVSTRELENFCEKTEIYSYNAEKFRKIVGGVETKRVPPEKIAKIAFRALSARRPKYVYNVNRNLSLRLLNILPAAWQTKIIGRVLKNR